MLRFILVNAAHTMIKYSQRMKERHLSIIKKVGKNSAIIAIARAFIETIYVMLTKGTEFIDNMDTLTERKVVAMRSRAAKSGGIRDVNVCLHELNNAQRRDRKCC